MPDNTIVNPNTVGAGNINPTPTNTPTPGTYIDPTLPTGAPLTAAQLNQLYGNSQIVLPSSEPQTYTQAGYRATPLNTDQSNLYNALMDFYQNTPESVRGAETSMSQLGGTYANTPEFQQSLNAQSAAATNARAQILAQRANPLYASAGLTAPQGGLTSDIAHQDLIQLATQHGGLRGSLSQGIPTTFDQGPMAATGYTGRPGTDYNTQLQSALAAYGNLHNVDQAAIQAEGGPQVTQQGNLSALDALQQYLLQQQANSLRTQLGLPTAPPGSIGS